MNELSNEKLKDELLRLTLKLNQVEQVLLEREKIAALGDLIPGITHDINTPLGVAVSAGSYLEAQNKRTNEIFESGKLKKSELIDYLANVKESTDIINGNLVRAVELIRNLKEISVYQSGDLKVDFDLCRYINTVVNTLKHEYKRTNHKVEVDCECINIHSYPGAYSQIVINLIMNSLTHGFKECDVGNIKLTVNRINGLTMIYSDDGHGIPEIIVDKIFEPFYTTKRDNGGTGLGLSIVKDLVENKLKGSITRDVTKTKGTTFVIRIPDEEIEKR